MPNITNRYRIPFILAHWLTAFLIVLLLAQGWYMQSPLATTSGRSIILSAHISLGLTTLFVIMVQICMRLAWHRPAYPDECPVWIARLSILAYTVIYICGLLMPLSGYFYTQFRGTEIQFWGYPLSHLLSNNETLASFFWEIHKYAAFVLVGSVITLFAVVVLGTFKGYRIGYRMIPSSHSDSHQIIPTSIPSDIAKITHKLSRNLRLAGWLDFWLQLSLAFISALLLIFATSGKAFSTTKTGIGDGMFWALLAFAMICITVVLAFYYTHIADHVLRTPDQYINPQKKFAFWLISLGMFVGVIGVLTSLTGVAASIVLLVAKTVSQPPGIAITDPNKIIRALDVFVLLVNFNLLMAHFIGTAASLWLSIKVAKSKFEYKKISSSENLPGRENTAEKNDAIIMRKNNG